MANVLLGWELGGGVGHVQTLIPLAAALSKAGHTPILALRNVTEPAPLLGKLPFPFVPAPVWLPTTKTPIYRASSYADVLAATGFADVGVLEVILRAWDSMLALVRPRLVICDHSPGLCLAAHRELPTLVIGKGFCVPPCGEAFPPLEPNSAASDQGQNVLEAIAKVQRLRLRPPPETLPSVFCGTSRFVVTFPELDPYRHIRADPVVGPSKGALSPLPMPGEPRLFAYLSAGFDWTEPVLTRLAELKVPLSAYISGATPGFRDTLRARSAMVYDEPQPIEQMLKSATAVLHHGGAGTSEAALAAGRPQLLMHRHLEQELTAKALEQLGVGVRVQGRLTGKQVAAFADHVLKDRELAATARQKAIEIEQRGPWHPLPRIVKQCLELLEA